jgi:asparagine N-glycosylation enzyme membrane subunit Stt3
VLWWHESPVVLQTLLVLALILYALDLINARDSLTVVSWISALVLTMLSGLGTLLQVDDSDASGGVMILHLVRLAVEGSLFCLMVSTNSNGMANEPAVIVVNTLSHVSL